jgi:LytS/YehU family sensor histidine kinase
VYLAIAIQRHRYRAELRQAQLGEALRAAELRLLQSQLNPHFLFNVLNTLYGTALHEHANRTAGGIQQLGDMMRFMLHDNNLNAIPLKKEIAYLRNYIDLQKLRIQSSVDIEIHDDIYADRSELTIAPMLLIPFVENAFKHGISLNAKSSVMISLKDEGAQLTFEVKNTRHSRRHADPEKHQSGVGLKNVRERLKLLYPGKHKFSIAESDHEFAIRSDLILI